MGFRGRLTTVSELAPGRINGLWYIGDSAGARVEIGTNGDGDSGIRMYDGLGGLLVDIDGPTATSIFRGIVEGALFRTATAGPRIEIRGQSSDPVDLSRILLFSGNPDHLEPAAISLGDPTLGNLVLGAVFDESVSGQQAFIDIANARSRWLGKLIEIGSSFSLTDVVKLLGSVVDVPQGISPILNPTALPLNTLKWDTVAGQQAPRYWKDGAGNIHLQGLIEAKGPNVAGDQISDAGALPTTVVADRADNCRPTADVRFSARISTGGVCWIDVRTGGTVFYAAGPNLAAGNRIPISGLWKR